ncbi:hypothetical protein KKA23_00755 [Patescibacteria group bacterium]|nr:hypothetical protein [Patescibacteria group bacterium]
MFQIKVQNKGFSFQLDFSGSIAQTLEKMPTEIREEFTGNIEDLLKAFCCIISGTILAPITAFNFFPRAFERQCAISLWGHRKKSVKPKTMK